MAAEYKLAAEATLAAHEKKLGITVEKAAAAALASQPDDPYAALAEFYDPTVSDAALTQKKAGGAGMDPAGATNRRAPNRGSAAVLDAAAAEAADAAAASARGTSGLMGSTEGASTTQYVAPQSQAGVKVSGSTAVDVQLAAGSTVAAGFPRTREQGPVRNNDEFCIKNKELCIKNEKLCIDNEDLCIKNGDFCRCISSSTSSRRTPTASGCPPGASASTCTCTTAPGARSCCSPTWTRSRARGSRRARTPWHQDTRGSACVGKQSAATFSSWKISERLRRVLRPTCGSVSKNEFLCSKKRNFVLTNEEFVLKMMNFVLK